MYMLMRDAEGRKSHSAPDEQANYQLHSHTNGDGQRPTNDDEDHTEDLDARPETGSEKSRVEGGTEHVAMNQLPACLLQCVILRGGGRGREREGNSMETVEDRRKKVPLTTL